MSWLIIDYRSEPPTTRRESDLSFQAWVKEYLYASHSQPLWKILVHTEHMLVLEWMRPPAGALYIEINEMLFR